METDRNDQVQVARRPCTSCPYRCDTPAGVWAIEEYEKLLWWDAETFEQPHQLFLCHHTGDEPEPGDNSRDSAGARPSTQTQRVCRGWLDVHGSEALGVRFAVLDGRLDPAVLDEEPAVALHPTGAAAAAAGIAGLANPSPEAVTLAERLLASNSRLHTRGRAPNRAGR